MGCFNLHKKEFSESSSAISILTTHEKLKKQLTKNSGKGKVGAKNLIQENTKKVSDLYKIYNKLGNGTFVIVYKVIDTRNYKMAQAMKIIKKNYVSLQDDDKVFLKEIEYRKSKHHQDI